MVDVVPARHPANQLAKRLAELRIKNVKTQ